MKPPERAPAKKPLLSTRFKIVATIVVLTVIACIVAIGRVFDAAFTPVEFHHAEAIVEILRQQRLARQ